jgi:taurine dioxygenase
MWKVTPLEQGFGAQIEDIDLRRPLSDEEAEQLRSAFYEHKLLVIKGEDLSADDQVRVVSYLGKVADEVGDGTNHSILTTDPSSPAPVEDALGYHNDFSFSDNPPTVISLYAVEMEPGGTPTLFRSNENAYETLPETTRERLSDLTAMRLRFRGRRRGRLRLSDLEKEGLTLDDTVSSVKPLVVAHPVTGEPFLWLTKYHTSHVCELDEDESEELLQSLFAHLDACPVYQHDWAQFDIVVWDNLAIQHARPDVVPTVRTLRRVVSYEPSLIDSEDAVLADARDIIRGSRNR